MLDQDFTGIWLPHFVNGDSPAALKIVFCESFGTHFMDCVVQRQAQIHLFLFLPLGIGNQFTHREIPAHTI